MKKVAFLGNYAPRCCGIATFTQDLRAAVLGACPGLEGPVTMVSDDPDAYEYPEEVHIVLPEKDRAFYTAVADRLNLSGCDVICLQHEYGIFGGPCGVWLLGLLQRVQAPVVTTCHTVLRDPSPDQLFIMQEIARLSARLVVMAEKGRQMLEEIYQVPSEKIVVIPHGIPEAAVSAEEPGSSHKPAGWENRRVLFTFGLVSPSKGLEYAIRALPEIVKRHPDTLYVITGATHPNLIREQGEAYRESLTALAEELGVGKHLQFINRFVSRDELIRLIAAADVYVTPYLNEAQITSGTLAYAFGMGKPVISTPYWHAAELLADGHGVLVPFRDPAALAEAAVRLFDNDAARGVMSAMAALKGREMAWTAVGRRYADVFAAVRLAESRKPARQPAAAPRPLPPLVHFENMMGPWGIHQHALFTAPDPAHGFCTDDNARAVIALTDYVRSGQRNKNIDDMFETCFHTLLSAFNPRSDRFRNFMDSEGRWLEPWGSDDSHGRALWALGHVTKYHTSAEVREAAARTLRAAAPVTVGFPAPRSWAFTLLGLIPYLDTVKSDETLQILRNELAGRLMSLFYRHASDDWPWFEDHITYDNGKLVQALLSASRQTGNLPWRRVALRALEFLIKGQTAPSGCFRPVGCNGFWQRNSVPAQWDQQPLEAEAMTAACLEAWSLTGQDRWMSSARHAHAWFTGGNDHGIPLADHRTGGCCDGLCAHGVNQNQGAESTLAWLQSSAALHLAAKTAGAGTRADIPVHPFTPAAA